MAIPPSQTVYPPFYGIDPNIKDVCSTVPFAENPLCSLLASIYLAAGLSFVLFGYRYFKASMFAIGFTFGLVVVYAICIQEQLLPLYGNVIVSVSAGFLFGLITMLIQYFGFFVSGLHNGVLLGASGLMIFNHLATKEGPAMHWLSILVVLMTGIIFACLNLYWKKGLTIIAYSSYGGAILTMSVDYFVERWVLVKWAYDRIKLEQVVPPPCPLSWLVLAIWPICIILGIATQWFITGTGIRHEESLVAMKRRTTAAPVHLTREQRAEMRQRKYRYLYQVRTAHGDVISQSYVQALQQKNTADPWNTGCPGECSTLQSDSTHLTVLAPDLPHPDSDEDINQIRVCH